MSVGAPWWLAWAAAAAVIAGIAVTWRGARGIFPKVLSGLAGAFLWALLVELRLGAQPTLPVVVTPGAETRSGIRWPDSRPGGIVSLEELPLPGGGGSVAVRGHGLPRAVWAESRLRPTGFDPPPVPPGFVAMSWPDSAFPGAPVTVRGTVLGPAERIALELAGEPVAEGTPDARGRFAVEFVAPVAAPVLLELVARGAGSTEIAREPLAIDVRVPPALSVRLTAARPDLDFRFFRDWFAEAGGQVLSEITLAPGVVRRETSGAAGDFPASPDLWLADAAWAAAGHGEALIEAARRGSGVLVFLRGVAPPPALGFEADPLPPGAEPLVTVGRPALALQRSARLRAGPDDRTVLAAADGEPLLVAREAGAGVLAVAAFTGIAGWITAGEARAAGDLLAPMVSALARPARGLRLTHAELLPTVGFRTKICTAPSPVLAIDPPPAWPLLDAGATDDLACRAWWPSAPGWHRLGDRRVYVYDRGHWSSWRAETRAAATQAMQAQGEGSGPRRPASRARWWLVAFVAASLALWLEQRLRRR